LLNVVVSGASRGLGLAIALALCRSGYRVIAIARGAGDELGAAMKEAADGPGRIEFVPCDLAALAAIPEMVADIRRRFGAVYGLVNNAAIGTPGVLATMPDGEIERLVRLNTLSPLVLTKHVVRSMMAHGEGRIVNIASIVGMTGYGGLSVYSATKASLLGFTRSLAREVGTLGITVNAVAPGFLDTEMTRSLGPAQRERIARRSALHRLAEPSDVADAVLFLIGDTGRNITGTVMTVDAGNTA
jgi:3-oxoacyl-[acyl-carrier protein] reductase